MAAEDAAAAVERDDRVLDVDVVDAVGEFADELDRVDALPDAVAGVEVEAELLAVAERVERPPGRVRCRTRSRSDALPARTARRIRRTRRESDSSGRRTAGSLRRSSTRAPAGTNTSRCQMLEPVKPLTTPTPNCWAARAVFFMSSAARRLTPAGSPSPHTCGGRIDWCRWSMRSHTAWPTRCELIAWHCRS